MSPIKISHHKYYLDDSYKYIELTAMYLLCLHPDALKLEYLPAIRRGGIITINGFIKKSEIMRLLLTSKEEILFLFNPFINKKIQEVFKHPEQGISFGDYQGIFQEDFTKFSSVHKKNILEMGILIQINLKELLQNYNTEYQIDTGMMFDATNILKAIPNQLNQEI